MKLFIVANTSWYLFNFRSNLIRALIGKGYEVVAIAPSDSFSKRLGCLHVDFKMSRAGMNPFVDLITIIRLLFIMRNHRPDLVLNFTPKINIYSSFVARLLGVPFINNIAGLGAVFVRMGILSRFVLGLYRVTQKKAARIFFQNEEDMGIFLSNSIIDAQRAYRIPGSGVDLDRFVPITPPSDKPFLFLMVARLVKEKGVYEYVEAARTIGKEYPYTRFLLGGFIESGRSSGIKLKELETWTKDAVVTFIGNVDDIIQFFKRAHCVVLPSFYKEGVPRILLEASAMAIPVITTDSIGCRETVEHGKNGFLCKPEDPNDLAEKMRMMLGLKVDERKEMGLYGRKKMEKTFDEKIVINAYFDAIAEIEEKKIGT